MTMNDSVAHSDVDELAGEMDPYGCEDCLAAGDDCRFHAGFAAGWDACGAFVARMVDEDRSYELVADFGDVPEGGLW